MHLVVGIDEVGRGCWAGPLVAGAVLLPQDFSPRNNSSWKLADSKTMTALMRQRANEGVLAHALAYGLGWVTPKEIDSVGLTRAVQLAMKRALHNIQTAYDQIIIDGNINFLANNPKASCLVKADSLVPAVSAASIIAKVARDNFMIEIATDYPNYGFDRHVGYGTKQHQEALCKYGITPIHRQSYKPVAKHL